MTDVPALPTFATFGEMLRYLRRSSQLTQQELARAVGYSESMISRLEHNERLPDAATIHALFVPALHLLNEPQVVARLLELVQVPRVETAKDSVHAKGSTARTADEPADEASGLGHFATYSKLAVDLGNKVLGQQHRQAMADLDGNYDQIRLAFEYARARPELADQRLRLAAAMPYYWHMRGMLAEGAAWLRDALADDQ